MHFIFASKVIFNLPVCPQKNLGWYDKTAKKYSKKKTPPPYSRVAGVMHLKCKILPIPRGVCVLISDPYHIYPY